jgi:ferric-dicitrate binding protein FerR (iron transport regulator)
LISALRRSHGADTEAWLRRVKEILEADTWENRVKRQSDGANGVGAEPSRNGVLGIRAERPVLSRLLSRVLFVAACVVVVFALGISYRAFHNVAASGMMTSYVTGNGQRAKIKLADNVTVVLGVASRLDVPPDYSSGHHVLHLTGEALFSVDHHTTHPLVIITRTSTTRVLGTSFLVREYATDSMAQVAVRTGKVSFGATVVSAAQAASMNHQGHVWLHAADPAQFAFESGKLVLNDVSLANAIVELNRTYDVDMRLGDSTLASRGVSGIFGPLSPAELADILELTFNVRVVRDGRVLTLFTR